MTISAARANAFPADWTGYAPPQPALAGRQLRGRAEAVRRAGELGVLGPRVW